MLAYILSSHLLDKVNVPFIQAQDDPYRDVVTIRLQPRPIGWQWIGTATSPSRAPRIKVEITGEDLWNWPDDPMHLIFAKIIIAMIDAGIR
jgi:hypothetical protein